MRIKNKEIRRRRHRKDEKIKDANRVIRAKYADKKTEPKPAKAPAKKATSKAK